MVNKGGILRAVHENDIWGASWRARAHFNGVLETFEYVLVFEKGFSMER